jgi:carbonic anhydrase/acetyltransferase-like protein (isoleucine patch superfamily)
VRDCVVGEEARIGSACSVSEGAVIGRGCRLVAAMRVADGQRVEPDQVLSGAQEPSAAMAGEAPRRRAIRLQSTADLLIPARN